MASASAGRSCAGALVVHIAAAVILVPALLIPFWASHRSLLAASRRPFLAWSGRVLELMLGVILTSGAWLLFIGWNGDAAGGFAHWTHLLLAVPLVLLVMVHAWRHSVVRRLAFGVVLLSAFAGRHDLRLRSAGRGREPLAASRRRRQDLA
ncbi:MAG: hypothetical protein WDM84_09670 [Bauldia sp.]